MAKIVGGVGAESLGSALNVGSSDNATGRLPPTFPDQRTRFIDNSRSERSVPALPEAFSHPKGLTVQEIWPSLYEEMAKGLGEKGEVSQNLLQGEAQGRYGETSSEQRDQDKGKEHLKPEEEKIASLQTRKAGVKANREGLEHMRKLLAEKWSSIPRRELATDTTSIVFVHGVSGAKPKGSGDGWNCYDDSWGKAIKFLQSRWRGDFRTIKYYTGDTNCHNGNDEGRLISDLHHSLYINLCLDYSAGKAGNE